MFTLIFLLLQWSFLICISRQGLPLERRLRRDVAAVRSNGGSERARLRDRVAQVQRDVLVPDRARPLRDEDGRVQVG